MPGPSRPHQVWGSLWAGPLSWLCISALSLAGESVLGTESGPDWGWLIAMGPNTSTSEGDRKMWLSLTSGEATDD